jgi:hypothetical protein
LMVHGICQVCAARRRSSRASRAGPRKPTRNHEVGQQQ